MVTDMRAAGLLAHAHRIANLAQANYQSPGKTNARNRALRFLAGALDPGDKMADLWGGGSSARAAVALDLSVVSIEDGRFSKSEHGIRPEMAKRALGICAQEQGYEWRWGKAVKFAGECQGAFWDFCGQWCPEMRRTLKASDHMKAIVVTMMPERIAVGHHLTTEEWWTTYRGLLLLTLPGHVVRWYAKYRRAGGQWAFVFGLVRTEKRRRSRLGSKPTGTPTMRPTEPSPKTGPTPAPPRVSATPPSTLAPPLHA